MSRRWPPQNAAHLCRGRAPAAGSGAACFDETGDRIAWAGGDNTDRESDGCANDREGDELQHGGEGAVEDDEASLGGTAPTKPPALAAAGSMGQTADLEEQCEDEGDISDNGIADSEALMEQVGDRAGFGYSGFARYIE